MAVPAKGGGLPYFAILSERSLPYMNETNQSPAAQLFRKDAIDRLNSPEKLDEYLHVARPGAWMLLAAVMVLLAGICVWGIFGHMDTIVQTAVDVRADGVYCYIRPDNVTKLQPGMQVKTSGETLTVEFLSDQPVYMTAAGDGEYLLSTAGLQDGEWAYVAELAPTDLPLGIYPGEIIVESISPMSFIVN